VLFRSAPNVDVRIAAAIERELAVPLGTLFGIDQADSALLREYLAARPEADEPTPQPQPEEG